MRRIREQCGSPARWGFERIVSLLTIAGISAVLVSFAVPTFLGGFGESMSVRCDQVYGALAHSASEAVSRKDEKPFDAPCASKRPDTIVRCLLDRYQADRNPRDSNQSAFVPRDPVPCQVELQVDDSGRIRLRQQPGPGATYRSYVVALD